MPKLAKGVEMFGQHNDDENKQDENIVQPGNDVKPVDANQKQDYTNSAPDVTQDSSLAEDITSSSADNNDNVSSDSSDSEEVTVNSGSNKEVQNVNDEGDATDNSYGESSFAGDSSDNNTNEDQEAAEPSEDSTEDIMDFEETPQPSAFGGDSGAEDTKDSGDDQQNEEPDRELLELKRSALQELSPLVDKLDQTDEEKFKTTMMMIQATDDKSLLPKALESAKAIGDEKVRAQALLDVVNEINYFTHQES